MASTHAEKPEHFTPIAFGTAQMICVVMLGVFLFGMLFAQTSGETLEAPMLFTVLAATFATGWVWLVTETVTASGNGTKSKEARTKATASYVFANAAGTVTSLAAYMATTAERAIKGQPFQNHDALTIVLGQLQLGTAVTFLLYLVVAGAATFLCFLLVMHAASCLKPNHTEPTVLQFGMSASSLGLLIIGLWLVTPWDAVPVSPEGPISALRTVTEILWLFAQGILFLFVIGLYSLVAAVALGSWATVFSQSVLRLGETFDAAESWSVFKFVLAEVWYGVLLAVSIGFALGLFWFLGGFLFSLVPSLPVEWESFSRASRDAVIVPAAFAGVLVAAICLALFFRVYGYHVLYGLLGIAGWLLAALFTVLKLLWLAVVFVASVIAAIFDLLIGFFPWLFSVSSTLTRGWFNAVWSRVRFTIEAPTLGVSQLAKGFVGLVLGWLLLSAITSVPWFASWRISTTEPGPNRPDESVTVAEDQTEQAPPLGFRFATPSPISLCEGTAGAFDWSLAKSDMVEIELRDCILPKRVREKTDSVLVFASVASTGRNQQNDVKLARDRAQSVALWASRQVLPTTPIYVLNLGMAKSDRSFSVGWYIFGDVKGVRPALATMLEPFPEGSTVPVEEVLNELNDGLMFADTLDRFTNCELFRYVQAAPLGQELQLVSEFDCRGRQTLP
jgi:hypothetical protein